MADFYIADAATQLATPHPGYAGILRYAPPSRYAATVAECQRYRSWGWGFGLIFQVQADRSLRGGAQGADDARRLNQFADECEIPGDVALTYVLMDPVGAAPSFADLDGPMSDYARAWRDTSDRPVLPYADYRSGEHVVAKGIVDRFWQTAGWAGSGQGSGGTIRCSDGSVRRLSRHAVMFQDVGQPDHPQLDRNHVLVDEVDWLHGGDFPTTTNPPEEDDPMATTYLWHIYPDAPAARVHGPGVFKALDTSDFVVPLAPDEVQLYHDIQTWHAATNPGKPPIVVDQINPPAAAVASRVLLPRGSAAAAVASAVLAALPTAGTPGEDPASFAARVAEAQATIADAYRVGAST